MPEKEKKQVGLKPWSFAGLLITNWCNARCESCYLNCRPELADRMQPDTTISYWRQLSEVSPTGCKIHLTGGEPFGDWPALVDLCRRANACGLGNLEKIETNAFWATDREVVSQRIRDLTDAGMGKLVISADPYHQRYVPISRCRLAAEVAMEILGSSRVQVRWRDWLADGFDTIDLPDGEIRRVYAEYAAKGRDRYNGRAADLLAEITQSPGKAVEQFAGLDCSNQIIGSKHVHICPGGQIMPGVCAGIMLAGPGETVAQARKRLMDDLPSSPVLSALVKGGPFELADMAGKSGFKPRKIYSSKCQFCFEIRQYLFQQGAYPAELGPGWVYGNHLK